MASSGRNGDEAERTNRSPRPDSLERIERGPDGRIIVRASSYPPQGSTSFPPASERVSPVDSSGVRSRPQELSAERAAPSVGRPGRSTPAERPRKRKALQDSGPIAEARSRCDTPRALPGSRSTGSHRALPNNAVASRGSSPAAVVDALSDAVSDVAASPVTPDEVTRRVRRPSSTPPAVTSRLPVRTAVIALAIAVLSGFAIWLGL